MIMKKMQLIAIVLMGVLVLVSGITAFAAVNVIPNSRLMDQAFAPNANDFKPSECASLNLTSIVTGTGVVQGTQGNDLILTDAGDDKLQGKNGDDCLVAGDGDDELIGNNGWDICIGGGGNDTFNKCEVEIQ
jgi:Ca2+-binding RTX toxin-like protein